MPPKVAIILLNYRGADDTIACLSSLKALTYLNFQAIVVDNDSQDDSVSKIREAYPDIELLESPANLGFSNGNNLGIRQALQDPAVRYVWILNNDTTVEPDSLTALVNVAEKHPRMLMGSLILYPDGKFQAIGQRVTRFLGRVRLYPESGITEGRAVESLSGCCMLIPREVFETVGLWNEDYFLYFEDNDFCLQAAKGGYTCKVVLCSRIYHKRGASTGKNKPLVTYYYQRNRLILAKRFFHPVQLLWIQLYTHYRLFRSTIKVALNRTPEAEQHHRAFALAVQDFYGGVRGKCPHQI